MAFGDSPVDEPLRNAWADFCRRLQEAGDKVFKNLNPATPLHRADAFRFLTQNLGQVFDLSLETKNTQFPVLHAFCGPYRKLGGDAADFVYHQAWIDGQSVYKISGNRGTARFINFTVQGPRPDKIPGTDFPSLHEPFGDIPEANLFGHQLKTNWDGSFELYVGGPERGPNWLPTTPGSRKLFLRQGFDSWDELPARMRIERIDMNEPRPVPTPDDFVAAMEWAGTFVTSLMNDWPDHSVKYSKPVVDHDHKNVFPAGPKDDQSDAKRGRAVAHMVWELAPDQALIIEFDRTDAFWMLSNNGAFMNSMDFIYRPVSYTTARTKADPDGKIRLILAHDDPGYHNWLDTSGFVLGNLTFRYLLGAMAPPIATRLVKRSDLESALPADSVRITPEGRTAQLHARFNSILQRYGL
jgi:hypothetical protein